MERGRRGPPRRGRPPARARPVATAARRGAPSVARPRGRADPGGAAARRCPTQSFTLAGDEAQAVRAGAAATWDRIVGALGVAAGSVARHELTVNYRTPAEVMELAARLLEQFAPHLHPARSVRTAGVGPRRFHTGGRPLGAAYIADAVADIQRDVGAGLVAVVTPEQLV